MQYKNKGSCLVMEGLDRNNSHELHDTLCPYSSATVRAALSCLGTKERIIAVDNAIQRANRLT
jgi:hypothetical protein